MIQKTVATSTSIMVNQTKKTKPWMGRKIVAALFGGIPSGLCLLFRFTTYLFEVFNLRSYAIVKWYLMTLNMLHMNYMPLWLKLLGVKVTHHGDDPWPCGADYTLVISNHQCELDSPLLEVMSTALSCYPTQIVGDNGQWYVSLQRIRGFFSYKKGDKDISEKLAEYLRTKLFPSFDWLLFFPEGGLLRSVKEKSDQFAIKNNLPVYKHVATPRIAGFQTIINTVGETEQEKLSGTASGGRIKWVLDVTIVYKSEIDTVNLFMETVPEDAAIHIVTQLYEASEVPRDEEGMKKWLFERYQEKDDIIDHFKKKGKMPKIKGRYTPCPPRPYAYGSIMFTLVYATYIFALFIYILLPFFTLIINIFH